MIEGKAFFLAISFRDNEFYLRVQLDIEVVVKVARSIRTVVRDSKLRSFTKDTAGYLRNWTL